MTERVALERARVRYPAEQGSLGRHLRQYGVALGLSQEAFADKLTDEVINGRKG